MIKKIFYALLAIVIVITLASCGANGIGETAAMDGQTTTPIQSEETPVEEPEYASEMTDAVLNALTDGDYDAFIVDMNATMISALPKPAFIQMQTSLTATVGSYTGEKTYIMTHSDAGITTVVYEAGYTEEPAGVTITISFSEEDGAMKVSGLYFNSPKLRGE